MAVGQGEIAADHPVLGDRRVDDEAQEARAHQVPEGDVDKAIHDGRVFRQPPPLRFLRSFDQGHVLGGLQAHESEGADLQGREAGPDGQDRAGRPREVVVVVHARDASEEEGPRGEEGHASGGLGLEEAKHHEDLGNNDGDEDLENTLHPHVDDPEAPIVHDGQVRARVVHQTRGIEARDQHGRARNDHDEVPPSPRALLTHVRAQERRPNGVAHEQEPDGQTHKQEALEETAQLHVLVALVAEPLAHEQALEGLRDGGDLTRHGAPDDYEQA
mmetsp:Transcript_97444/g.297751  ORF Transcript_97444/g.297751 Transcript_97444/m.297751 type:complete len:273 (+) Transcript_97444:408-1226(+)